MSELTEKLSAAVPSWGAKLAYGPKTVVGGVDIVPVAVVSFGFGAGEFSQPSDAKGETPTGTGEGGGGGGMSFPLGVYVGEGDAARFKPNLLVAALAAASVITAVGVAVSSIVYAARKR